MKNRSREIEKAVEPEHYKKGKIEPIDFVISHQLNFLEGNVVKYIIRYKWKSDPLVDLKKARYYLDRLIQEYSH